MIKKENENSHGKKSGKYSEEELIYIKTNYKSKTDKKIAEEIGRPETGIVEQRKKMGLTKDIGRPKNQPVKLTPDEYYSTLENKEIMADLTPIERKRFAVQLFKNSIDYKRLIKQFTDDEIEVYTALFSDYLSEFQRLLPQEVQQVHILVKEQIIQDRFLQKIKLGDSAKIKIQEMQELRNNLFIKPDKTDEENHQLDEIEKIIDDIKLNMEPVENIWKEFNDSSMRAERALKALKFTREQRLKDKEEHGKTLVSVAQKLNDAKVREEEGEYSALLNREKEKFKKEARDKKYIRGKF